MKREGSAVGNSVVGKGPSLADADAPVTDLDLALRVTAATLALYAVCFFGAALQFAIWRQNRTEFAFRWLPYPAGTILGWVLVNWFAIRLRAWYLPIVVGFIFVPVVAVPMVWSGPGDLLDAIMPLVNLRVELLLISALVNALLVAHVVLRPGTPHRDR